MFQRFNPADIKSKNNCTIISDYLETDDNTILTFMKKLNKGEIVSIVFDNDEVTCDLIDEYGYENIELENEFPNKPVDKSLINDVNHNLYKDVIIEKTQLTLIRSIQDYQVFDINQQIDILQMTNDAIKNTCKQIAYFNMTGSQDYTESSIISYVKNRELIIKPELIFISPKDIYKDKYLEKMNSYKEGFKLINTHSYKEKLDNISLAIIDENNHDNLLRLLNEINKNILSKGIIVIKNTGDTPNNIQIPLAINKFLTNQEYFRIYTQSGCTLLRKFS